MKIGIALAGGGARGAYQIGVWKAFKEYGIDEHIQAYSGASVGSINAVLFAMGDYQKAEDLWMSLDKDTLFHVNTDIVKRFFKERWKFFTKGVFDTRVFEQMMDETLEMDQLRGKKVYIATTAIGGMRKKFFRVLKANYKYHFAHEKDNLKYYDIDGVKRSKIKKIILASCAIPVVFRPIQIDEETYYDGGILNNTPYQPLLDCQCDRIIVIDLFRLNLHRSKDIKQDHIKVISPSKGLRGILDFNPKRIRYRFQLGYEDGIRFIEENKEFLQVK